jgi:hypothetical protein
MLCGGAENCIPVAYRSLIAQGCTIVHHAIVLRSSSGKQTYHKQAQCLRLTAALTFRLPQIISSVHTPKGSVRVESTCFLVA